MVTTDEETQAKEFLKRAEIRTMRKDLLALREVDTLKERDKIVKLRTLEEQIEEQKKKNEAAASAKTSVEKEKTEREEVLQKNENQEIIAEKDLKNYATEQERQQIFLLESQRLGFEKQIDSIDKEKDPETKLGKNKLLLQKRDQQAKLNSILEQEKKLENEQKFITDKEQTTTIDSQRKSLQESRQDVEKKIEDIEKTRWAAEKEVADTDINIGLIDKSLEQLVTEKNSLRDKILGVDKSLREIYSAVMAREEEKRRGQEQDQINKREALSKIRTEEREKVQREQWSPSALKQPSSSLNFRAPRTKSTEALEKIPRPVREKPIGSSATEAEQREKFLQDVENSSESKQNPSAINQQFKKETFIPPSPPVRSPTPPMPPKKTI